MELKKTRHRSHGKQPIQDSAWLQTFQNLPILHGLSSEETDKLIHLAKQFEHDKVFEGAEGITVTDDIRTSISIQAALPVLELSIDWYKNWQTIVVVPKSFTEQRVSRDRAGVVHEWAESDSGESWNKGPVVLSWRDVQASGWQDGFNVVIHEAAHRLDMTDGSINGRPALHKNMDAATWYRVCSEAFDDLVRRSQNRRPPPINTYATESDAEFFAVLTEHFFERPDIVRREYPDLYDLFSAFYRQDPAARMLFMYQRA